MPKRALSAKTFIRVERLTAFPIPGVGVGVLAGTVAVGVAVGTIVAVGLGVGVVGMMVADGLAVAVGLGVGVVGGMVGLTVAVGVGVAGLPQPPLTLNTMCMPGNPIAAVVVGVLIPQPVALR
jgi:hypothetical protein